MADRNSGTTNNETTTESTRTSMKRWNCGERIRARLSHSLSLPCAPTETKAIILCTILLVWLGVKKIAY